MIKKITEYLNSVREEVILYTGLNYNIDEIGSLKRDLTLYLDIFSVIIPYPKVIFSYI